jgi:hypothetical protein
MADNRKAYDISAEAVVDLIAARALSNIRSRDVCENASFRSPDGAEDGRVHHI